MKNLLCSSETEIPEVDNTDIPCDIFYSSECVVMQNLSQTVKNYFNLGDTPTLTEYAEAVALALKDAHAKRLKPNKDKNLFFIIFPLIALLRVFRIVRA